VGQTIFNTPTGKTGTRRATCKEQEREKKENINKKIKATHAARAYGNEGKGKLKSP
jgi:hypothetical protein